MHEGLPQEASALAAGISKAEHAAASLGSRLALAEQRVNELQASKQDVVTAVTMDMVNARVANVRPRPLLTAAPPHMHNKSRRELGR